MNKKNNFKRGITTMVSLLFIVITIIPSINGFTQENLIVQNKIMPAPTQNGYNITVETDRYYYYSGETVHFFGQLTENGVGFRGRIQYELRDPTNNPFFGGMRFTDYSGFFDIEYNLWESALIGLYNFKVEYYDDTSVFAKVSFEVLPNLRIEKITGGLGQIHVGISNDRGEDLHDVTWSIKVVGASGFFLFQEKLTQGSISLLGANEKVSIETSGLLVGLGALEIYVTTIAAEQRNTEFGIGFIFFLVIICTS